MADVHKRRPGAADFQTNSGWRSACPGSRSPVGKKRASSLVDVHLEKQTLEALSEAFSKP